MLSTQSHMTLDEERPNPAMPGCYMSRGSPIVFGSFASLLLFEICQSIRVTCCNLLNFLVSDRRLNT